MRSFREYNSIFLQLNNINCIRKFSHLDSYIAVSSIFYVSFGAIIASRRLVDASSFVCERVHQFADDLPVQFTFASKDIICEVPSLEIVISFSPMTIEGFSSLWHENIKKNENARSVF